MRFNTLIALAGAGSLVVMASLVPRPGEAQIARRVAAVRDGKVRMSFASRPDVCGWGDGINTGGTGSFNNTRSSSRQTEDVVYERGCAEGPARVVFTMRGGDIAKVKTYVGGQWKPLGSGDLDVGTVPAREAADYLFSLADRGVEGTVFPATLADSVDVIRRLYDLGRDESKDKEVRDQAVFWLSQQDDDAAVGLLENILKNSKSSDIKDKAIFGLSQHHSGKGFAILRSYAENSSEPDKIREKAIFWLGQRQSDNLDYLSGLYRRLDSNDLKDKVIFAMSQQRTDNAMQWLVDLATNSSEPIENRKKALFWAGQTGGNTERLTAMYDNMREREMREQMIFVLSQRRDGKALDKLMSIARSDPDREMRKKAMFWLGQSHDPRVTSFLADIINR
jgi:hypothetical protein